MTTIVANLEGMAADHRCTEDGPPLCHTWKIKRVGESLFGLAGDVMAGLAVLEWLDTPKRNRALLYKMFGEEVQWRYEMVLLELSPHGLALWNAWGIRMPLRDSKYAIGTGGAVALDALENGASLEDSILRALGRDQYSGLHGEESPDVRYLDEPAEIQLPAPKTTRKRR